MISAIELKKYITSAGIFDIIIGKLRHGKKLCPIILLKVIKDLKICFYCAILSFDQIVRLEMESGGESPLNAKEII